MSKIKVIIKIGSFYEGSLNYPVIHQFYHLLSDDEILKDLKINDLEFIEVNKEIKKLFNESTDFEYYKLDYLEDYGDYIITDLIKD